MPLRQILCLLFLSGSLPAQTYFQKTYAYDEPVDYSLDLEIAADGRIMLLLNTLSPADHYLHGKILLLDTHGAVISQLTLGSETPIGTQLALRPNGVYFLGLSWTSRLTVGSNSIGSDPFYALIRPFAVPTGMLVRRIIPLDDDSCVVLASRPRTLSGTEAMSSIFKIGSQIFLPWERTWADGQHTAFSDLARQSSGSLYAAGDRDGQALLTKLSAGGDLVWEKIFEDAAVQKIWIDAADHLWLCGTDAGGTGRLQLRQLDTAGNVLWSKIYASAQPIPWRITDLAGLANGDVLIGCHDPALESSRTALLRIDAGGQVVWSVQYAASRRIDHLLAVGSDAAGDLIAAGITGEDADHLQPWVIRTDPSGDIPGCCLNGLAWQVSDRAPTTLPVVSTTTSMLENISGGLGYIDFPKPVVTALCDHRYSPNAFTPNGDQINDRFLPNFTCPPEAIRFTVYNRWGAAVFTTVDPTTFGWDGNIDGQPAPGDVYGWLLEYDTFIDGQTQTKREKGEITLLR